MTRGTKKRIDFPDLLDEVPPLLRRDAPRLRREMLDDFHRRVSFGATPLLCCCCGLARGLLLCLLCTLPALTAHLVGVPAVVNGVVDGNDLATLLGSWGPAAIGTVADFDGNRLVDGSDLAVILSGWGLCQ